MKAITTAPRLPLVKNQPKDSPKEAGQEKSNTKKESNKNPPNVHNHSFSDRKAKIRIPELTSSLLSFKAFLQNQVHFLQYSG